MVSTAGMALPTGALDGTCTFTWYSATKPGARPANVTGAFTPPIVTVAVATVLNSGEGGASCPSAGTSAGTVDPPGPTTVPNPVAEIWMHCPRLPGHCP